MNIESATSARIDLSFNNDNRNHIIIYERNHKLFIATDCGSLSINPTGDNAFELDVVDKIDVRHKPRVINHKP